jgi:hypothetical protein
LAQKTIVLLKEATTTVTAASIVIMVQGAILFEPQERKSCLNREAEKQPALLINCKA